MLKVFFYLIFVCKAIERLLGLEHRNTMFASVYLMQTDQYPAVRVSLNFIFLLLLMISQWLGEYGSSSCIIPLR